MDERDEESLQREKSRKTVCNFFAPSLSKITSTVIVTHLIFLSPKKCQLEEWDLRAEIAVKHSGHAKSENSTSKVNLFSLCDVLPSSNKCSGECCLIFLATPRKVNNRTET